MQWLTIDYLSKGNERQRKIHQLIKECRIMEILSEFSPVIAGTIPIDIDLKNSDIDVICEVMDFKLFEVLICENFGKMKDFNVDKKCFSETGIITASFSFHGEVFEIYGEQNPVKKQNAFLHMIKESEIIESKGEEFRQKIIQLKKEGIKTEPAFAKLLGLKGDPYVALLHYQV